MLGQYKICCSREEIHILGNHFLLYLSSSNGAAKDKGGS
jgi:hypothetical protein